MDCSPTGSSVHRISQARIVEWVAISFSTGSSWPKDQTPVSWIPCTGRRIFYHWATLEAPFFFLFFFFKYSTLPMGGTQYAHYKWPNDYTTQGDVSIILKIWSTISKWLPWMGFPFIAEQTHMVPCVTQNAFTIWLPTIRAVLYSHKSCSLKEANVTKPEPVVLASLALYPLQLTDKFYSNR